MTDEVEVQTVFCPDCDEDYSLVWSDDKEVTLVACDCGEVEPIGHFLERMYNDFADEDPEASMFQ